MRATPRIFKPVDNMNAATTHDLEKLSAFFVDAFPKMNPEEQVLARTIYQQLAQGKPLSLESLAGMLNQAVEVIKKRLVQWGSVFYNNTGGIIGFLGITVDETHHRMQINGKTSYAWCAWDTLFIPELVGATAQVTSTCATTNKPITLAVTPQGVRSAPVDIWVSFLLPDEKAVQENVTTSFCCHVRFFSSRAAGGTWTAQNEGTFLLTLDDAFKVGKKVNAARYANVL